MEENLLLLQEMLSVNTNELGINTYNIIEYNRGGNVDKYRVSDLNLVIENNIAIFMDSDELLFNSNYLLKYFIISTVCNVEFNINNIWCNIIFATGGRISISPVI